MLIFFGDMQRNCLQFIFILAKAILTVEIIGELVIIHVLLSRLFHEANMR